MSEKRNPAIVIPCYKKIKSLRRLLASLAKAKYPSNVPLIFSVDYSGRDDVKKSVEKFNWPFGEKLVICHDQNLGLRNNVLSCGDLSYKYGSVIVLEDDTYVSHDFYTYAIQAKNFYQDKEKVAGISLYAYEYSEIALERFYPIYDSHDTYFMQWASSWGQLWTSDQWTRFSYWYRANKFLNLASFNIPENVVAWPESSWKKYFIAYLVDTGRFFVYPHMSFVTNCGDAGFHCKKDGEIDKQVPLPSNFDISMMKFSNDDSLVKYDCFFQIKTEFLKMNPRLQSFDFDVDLAGTKPKQNVTKKFLLSPRKCRSPIMKFDNVLTPFPLNALYDLPGEYFSLGRCEDFDFSMDSINDIGLACANRCILGTMMHLKMVFDKIREKFLRKLSPFAPK